MNSPKPPSKTSLPLPRLSEWFESSQIPEPLASEIITPNCFAWAGACSPPDASIAELSLAVMDLGLWFVYLDDYRGDDYASLFRACAEVLDGGRPSPVDHPVLRLFADHHARIRELPATTSRYVDLRKDLLAQYERRNDAGRSGRRVGFDEYLDIRLSTTGIEWWMSVWELLLGFEPSPSERSAASVDRAIDALERWFVFVNEGRSVARDIAAQVPNLALIYARERGGQTTLAEAIAHLERLASAAQRDFEVAASKIRVELPRSPSARGIERFLRLCLQGASSLYSRSLERYPLPSDDVPPVSGFYISSTDEGSSLDETG